MHYVNECTAVGLRWCSISRDTGIRQFTHCMATESRLVGPGANNPKTAQRHLKIRVKCHVSLQHAQARFGGPDLIYCTCTSGSPSRSALTSHLSPLTFRSALTSARLAFPLAARLAARLPPASAHLLFAAPRLSVTPLSLCCSAASLV